MKLIKKELDVFEAVQFDITSADWPDGVVLRPGQGTFLTRADGTEIGIKDGDWILNGKYVISDEERKERFRRISAKEAASIGKVLAEGKAKKKKAKAKKKDA